MKVKYIGKGSYYHHPYLFDRSSNTNDVEEDVGTALLKQPKLFQKIAESKKKVDPVEEVEEEIEIPKAKAGKAKKKPAKKDE